MTAAPVRPAVERLLRPRSVAVIGASASPGALGASVIGNLDRMQFTGDLHLVNPGRRTIGSRHCLNSVADLPLGVDVAVLAIPRASVLSTIVALARRQVGAAIIFAAGFAEAGEAGLAEQRELARIARDAGMLLEGPNCLGLVNYVDGVALTFVETPAVALGSRPGIAIVSQSGALAAVVAVTLSSKALGVSYSISTGNEAGSGVEDYVEYLLDDEHTQIFALVVERFREPRRFLGLARAARLRGKAIVLLHPGRSGAARASATTHTGAMAGDHGVMCAKVRRAGVLLADGLEEFCDILDVILRCRTRPSGGAAVLTESGAFKALALDLCDDIGLPLPPLTDATAPLLREALPAFAPVSNPVDLTAQGLVDPDLYRRSLTALVTDPRFGCILLALIQTDARTSTIKFPPIIHALRSLATDKPVIFAGMDEGAAVPSEYVAQLRDLGVPYFPSPSRAFRAVARICALTVPLMDAAEVPAQALPTDLPSGIIPEYRAKELLKSWEIPFPDGRLATTLGAALDTAADLGYPVVLKAQATDLPHKSTAGGVMLDVTNPAALTAAWTQIHATLACTRPGLILEGVLVERMSKKGVELIVGGRNDPEWGAVVLVGLGGARAELLADVQLFCADSSGEEILREIDHFKSAALLSGFRGAPTLDVIALAALVGKMAALLRINPKLQEVDLNPVVVYPTGLGAIAVDALMVISS